MPILDAPEKMSNTIEKTCQMGSRGRRFRTPRNMSKNVKMTCWGYPKWTVPKMSKILEQCQKLSKIPKNCEKIPKSTSPGPHLTFVFDCVGRFPGTLQNRHFDIFLTFFGISGNTLVTLGSAHYGTTSRTEHHHLVLRYHRGTFLQE